MKRIASFIFLLLFSFGAYAVSATDTRLNIITYNPDEIINLPGNHFIATDIQFANDEQILSIDIGDPLAWKIEINKSVPNMFFIKPVMQTSDTNMTVVTNKHVYRFHLYIDENKSPTYGLVFQYPKTGEITNG